MAFLSIVMIFAVQGTGIAVQLTTQWKLPELCGGKEVRRNVFLCGRVDPFLPFFVVYVSMHMCMQREEWGKGGKVGSIQKTKSKVLCRHLVNVLCADSAC